MSNIERNVKVRISGDADGLVKASNTAAKQVDALAVAIERAQNQIPGFAKAREPMDRFAASTKTVQAAVDAATDGLAHANQEWAAWQDKLAGANKTAAETAAHIGKLEDQIEQVAGQIDAQRVNIEEFFAAFTDHPAAEQLAGLQEEFNKVRDQIKEINAAQTQWAKTTAQVKTVQRLLNQETDPEISANYVAQLHLMRSELEHLKPTIEGATDAKATLNAKLRNISKQIKAVTGDLGEEAEALTNSASSLRDLEERHAELERALAGSQAQQEANTEQVKDATRAIETLSEQIAIQEQGLADAIEVQERFNATVADTTAETDRVTQSVLDLKALNTRMEIEQWDNAFASLQESIKPVPGLFGRVTDAAREKSAALGVLGAALAAQGRAMTNWVMETGRAAQTWEQSFASVLKTTDAFGQEIGYLEGTLLRLAETMPMTHDAIAATAAMGGQLGVPIEYLTEFTEVALQLGVATYMGAEQASMGLARFMNIMGDSHDMVRQYADVMIYLGNNTAATEAEILQMSMRIAGAGQVAGMSMADIQGMAAALMSVGVQAEAGGTAIQRVIIQITQDVAEGGENLAAFAQLAGMAADDFARAWGDNAANALGLVLRGLGDLGEDSAELFDFIDGFVDGGLRVRDVLLRSSAAVDLWDESLAKANMQARVGGELMREYSIFAGTVEAAWIMARNSIENARISFGETFAPAARLAANTVQGLFSTLAEMPQPLQVIVGQTAAFAGGTMVLGGALLATTVAVARLKTAFADLGVAKLLTSSKMLAYTGAAHGATAATVALAAAKKLLLGPVGLVSLALGGAAAGMTMFALRSRDAQEAVAGLDRAIGLYSDGVVDATDVFEDLWRAHRYGGEDIEDMLGRLRRGQADYAAESDAAADVIQDLADAYERMLAARAAVSGEDWGRHLGHHMGGAQREEYNRLRLEWLAARDAADEVWTALHYAAERLNAAIEFANHDGLAGAERGMFILEITGNAAAAAAEMLATGLTEVGTAGVLAAAGLDDLDIAAVMAEHGFDHMADAASRAAAATARLSAEQMERASEIADAWSQTAAQVANLGNAWDMARGDAEVPPSPDAWLDALALQVLALRAFEENTILAYENMRAVLPREMHAMGEEIVAAMTPEQLDFFNQMYPELQAEMLKLGMAVERHGSDFAQRLGDALVKGAPEIVIEEDAEFTRVEAAFQELLTGLQSFADTSPILIPFQLDMGSQSFGMSPFAASGGAGGAGIAPASAAGVGRMGGGDGDGEGGGGFAAASGIAPMSGMAGGLSAAPAGSRASGLPNIVEGAAAQFRELTRAANESAAAVGRTTQAAQASSQAAQDAARDWHRVQREEIQAAFQAEQRQIQRERQAELNRIREAERAAQEIVREHERAANDAHRVWEQAFQRVSNTFAQGARAAGNGAEAWRNTWDEARLIAEAAARAAANVGMTWEEAFRPPSMDSWIASMVEQADATAAFTGLASTAMAQVRDELPADMAEAGEAMLEELIALGPDAHDALAMFTSASVDERARLIRAWQGTGSSIGQRFGDEIAGKSVHVAAQWREYERLLAISVAEQERLVAMGFDRQLEAAEDHFHELLQAAQRRRDEQIRIAEQERDALIGAMAAAAGGMSRAMAGAAQAMRAELAAFRAEQAAEIVIPVRVETSQVNGVGIGGGNRTQMGMFNQGGLVPGNAPANPRADNVLAMVRSGEFVQSQPAVDFYGPKFMAALNRRQIPKDVLPRFNQGGMVGPAVSFSQAGRFSIPNTNPDTRSGNPINITVNYPVNEPTSVATNRALQQAAAIGM